MSSSIKLTNSSGKIVTITNPDTTSADVAVDLLNNAYTIATVNDFGTVPVGYTTVIVKDTDRGGVFNRIASTTANGGTIFDGTTGYSWERQYSGAVNVKWFGAVGDGVTDDTTAIQAALNAVATTYGSVNLPIGNYVISTTITIPTRCGVICDPCVILTYTGTDDNVILPSSGVNFVGNGVVIKCTNANWNGTILYIDGVNRYADDYPASFDGINCLGNTTTKGTGLGLTATNATNFISFVRFSNITFNNLYVGLTLNCGSSGSVGDSATWHWINGNIFENFNFYGTQYGLNLVGTEGVPAEVGGNFFNNFSFATPNIPVYTNGPSRNFFNNFYIWDWNFGSGNPVIFDGASVNNQFNGNIDPGFVTGNATNGVWHLGTGKVTKITSFGDVWAYGTHSLRLGYAGYEATINGENQLILTPRSGYNTQVASQFVPTTDNTYKLGDATARWTVVYASTGSINTSDGIEKQQVKELTHTEKAVALKCKSLIRSFKFNDAVAEKGDKARIHFGVIAQDIKTAFESEGLNVENYGLFCSDTWYTVNGKTLDEKGVAFTKDNELAIQHTRLGVRYDELFAFIIGSI